MKKSFWVCMVVAVLLSGIGCGNGAVDFGASFSAEDVDVVLTTGIVSVEESVVQTEQRIIEERASSSSSPLTETKKQTEKEKTQSKPPVMTTARSTVPSVVTNAPPQTTVAPETQAPTTVASATTQALVTAPPTTEPQTLAPPIQADFDPDIYVQYAISYGKSIGLTYHPEVHESWDNPIDAGAAVSGEYLKSSIRSRLNRYKNVEGFEYFNVWVEGGRNSEYRIVIAYA